MTTAETYGEDRRWWLRAVMWIGHRAPFWDPVMYASMWFAIAWGWWAPENTPMTDTIYLVGYVGIVGGVAAVICGHIHDSRLCTRHTAAVVLDPQGAVNRRSRLLLFHHRMIRHRALSIGIQFAPLMVAVVAMRLPPGVRLVGTVVAVAGIAVGIRAQRSDRVHRQLQPWCPYCPHRGDGGGGVHSPVPDPAGSGHHR